MAIDTEGATITVHEDVLDGGSGEIRENEHGYESMRRVFIIEGLTFGTATERAIYALQESGIPTRGEGYPGMPYQLASSFDGSFDDPTIYRVVVHYRPVHLYIQSIQNTYGAPSESSEPIISVGSTLVEIETRYKWNPETKKHETIIVPYITKDAAGDNIPASQQLEGRPATIRYSVPVATMTFTREEPNDPLEKSLQYVGTVNDRVLFNRDPRRTWICRGINGESRNNGESYTVTYEFQRAPRTQFNETWDSFAWWTDPKTGEPPAAAKAPTFNDVTGRYNDDGNGVIGPIELLPESDFGDLNLSSGVVKPPPRRGLRP